MLNEFGKFPIFEDNWEPSDFNVTKAFILGENNFLKTSVISQNHGISIFMEMEPFNYFFNESSILELLRDDLKLSNNISSEISLNFRDYKDQVYEVSYL